MEADDPPEKEQLKQEVLHFKTHNYKVVQLV